MADFIKAYNKTGKNEGEYSNDPSDRGGETFCGVARKMNPHWDGWEIIDSYRSNKNFPKCLNALSNLELLVQEFYKKNYWNVIRGDEILNQEISESIYDSAVNMGCREAVKLAQQSLNTTVTGIMDDDTLSLLNNKA